MSKALPNEQEGAPQINGGGLLGYQLEPDDLAQSHRERPNADSFTKLINSVSSMSFDVRLHNNGTATAKEVYIVVQTEEVLSYHEGEDWNRRKNPQGQAAFAARRSLHPGEVSTLFTASLEEQFYNKPSEREDGGGWGIIPHFNQLGLRFLMYAANSDPQVATAHFTGEDLHYEPPFVIKKGIPA